MMVSAEVSENEELWEYTIGGRQVVICGIVSRYGIACKRALKVGDPRTYSLFGMR
jgi:hypothetical protein